MEELRARKRDKFLQVEERRRAIETAERERWKAILKKNIKGEEKILSKVKTLLFFDQIIIS